MLRADKLSLRVALVTSFVFLIAATAGGIGYISLQNGKRAVGDLANQLQDQILVGIRGKLGDYLATPHALNRLNADIIAENPATIEALETLRPIYIRQLKAFDSVSTVAVGIEKQGNFVGVGRRENGLFASGLRNEDGIYRVSLLDSRGKAIRLLTETPGYDARTRDWYKIAVQAGKAAWSPVYIWTANSDIGITAVLPVYDDTGTLIAVHQTALTLEFIGRFLKELQIGKSGQVFLAEQNGMLVASSSSEKMIRKTSDRVKASESSDVFIRAAAAHISGQLGDMKHIPDNYHSTMKTDGRLYFISAAKLSDPHGLNWILVAGLPESDVMARIDANTKTTIGLCIIASLAAIWLALFTARRLTSANQRLEAEVAERKRTEEELIQAKEAAETANKAKSMFLASMSHELRTPLNAILGYAQFLQKDPDVTEHQKERLKIIHKSGDHLLSLINDILDLSKIEAGRIEIHSVVFFMPDFLNNIAAMFQIRAIQKGIGFHYEASPCLPKSVRGDEVRLRQILINLLGNAVKFTEKGSVTFVADYRDGRICFEIRDTGPGIGPDESEKIFDPFYQTGSYVKKYEGTGLGLSISRRLAEIMGGSLTVQSTPGQGSVFRVELELPASGSGEYGPESQDSSVITGYKGARRKVLIVDDIEQNRFLLADLLISLGFEVSEADNGERAAEQAEKLQPDLILMDLFMPGMDGFEAVKMIRKSESVKWKVLSVKEKDNLNTFHITHNKVIIAVSAGAFEEHILKSREAGSDDFIPKPVAFEQLLAKMKQHLNLEWIYRKAEAAAPDTASELIIPPGPEDLESLMNPAKMGDIQAIRERAEALMQKDNRLVPFSEELIRLAKGFQMSKIRAFLKSFQEKG